MKRRHLIQAGTLGAVSLAAAGLAHGQGAAGALDFEQAIGQIEVDSGGRLGVAILDTGRQRLWSHRGDQRFPMCSTFKFLLAAQVLARVDQRLDQLDRPVAVRASDLIPYAPVTGPRAGGTPMTVAELCDAAVTLSDNVAANLLMRDAGGPAALTSFVRALGDAFTRLDRIEPELNEAAPGDPRDTTTPEAMLRTMQKIVLGQALSSVSREHLTRWLLASKTGDRKLRARLPPGWSVGDKTGAGANGTNNDIGVLWPPGRSPLLVTAYLTGTTVDAATRDLTLARVGLLAASL